jgi:hypothetical protein
VGRAELDGCGNWSVRAESLTDRKVSGLRIDDCRISSTSTAGGNGGVGIGNARGISLGTVSIRQADPVVAFSVRNAEQLTVDRLNVTIGKAQQPVATAMPCMTLDHADGVINDMEVVWPGAPGSWSAVQLSGAGQCGADRPVVIGHLKIVPAVGSSAISCS